VVFCGLDWLIAFAMSAHHTRVDEFSQSGANCDDAQAAESAQLLHADRLIRALKDLPDPL